MSGEEERSINLHIPGINRLPEEHLPTEARRLFWAPGEKEAWYSKNWRYIRELRARERGEK